MKTKECMHSLLAAIIVLASPLSYASTDVIVTAPARYVETCKNHVCTQHQVPSTHELFFNPDGLPAPRVAGKHVPMRDCIYHGHALKPGGEAERYDRETGTHWYRMCRDVNGHGVMSPAVN